MPGSSNPYHLWLGLPEKLISPNHYQLLGIQSNEQDITVIEAAYRKRLKQLQAIDPGQHIDAHSRVISKTQSAFQVLRRPESRQQYDLKLRKKIAKVKEKRAEAMARTVAPVAPPEESQPVFEPMESPPEVARGASPAVHSEAVVPAPIDPAPIDPATSVPGPVSEGLHQPDIPTYAAPPADVSLNPPAAAGVNMAIPMATPMAGPASTGATPVAPTPVAAIPTALVANSPAANMISGNAGAAVSGQSDAIDEVGKLQSLHVYRRRRSPWAKTIVWLLCIGAVIGLVAVVYNFRHLATAWQNDPDTQQTQTAGDGRNVDGTDGGNVRSPQAGNDSNSQEAGSGESQSSAGGGAGDNVVETVENGSSDSGNPLGTNPPGSGTTEEEVSNVPVPPVKMAAPLTFEQQVEFRWALKEARLAMYRRDKQRAGNALSRAVNLLGRNSDNSLPAETQQLKSIALADQVVLEFLTGFWEHVLASAKSLGTRDVEVDGRIISLVEATDDRCLFRIAGKNIAYSYEMLPAAIAVRLAEMGAKPDVARFQMQKASFYAVHQTLNETYGQKAINFAMQASEFGFDPEPIKTFVTNYRLEGIGKPESKVKSQGRRELEDAMVRQLPVSSMRELSRISGDEALGIYEEISLRAAAESDVSQRIVLLECAVKAGSGSGDVRLALDALEELNHWVEIPDLEARREKVMIDTSESDLDQRLALLLLEEGVRYTRRVRKIGKTPDEKFGRAMEVVAGKHDLEFMIRRFARDDP